MLATCAVILGVSLLGTAPTIAEESPIPPAPEGSGQFLESWALAPTGSDPSQPSSRPNLTYSLAPGTNATDSVSLWNYSDVQLTFSVYATDAYNNRTGEFTLLPGNLKPKNAGTWITLQTNSVTVPARTRVDIPMEIRVPADATPGDHTAGVVASAPTGTTTASGQTAIVDRRTGSRAYVRVTGAVDPSLVVENLSTDYRGAFNPLDGTVDVTYTLRNPGNVRLGARQVVEITDIFGRSVATRKGKTIPELLPGNAVTLHEKVTGVPATLRVSASVKIDPVEPLGVTDKAPAPKTWSSSAWAIPWTLLLLLLLAFLLWRLARRYRHARRGSAPLAGGGAGGGGGGGGRGRGPGPGSDGRVPRPQERVLQ